MPKCFPLRGDASVAEEIDISGDDRELLPFFQQLTRSSLAGASRRHACGRRKSLHSPSDRMIWQLSKTILPLFVIVFAGTVGYAVIEGWSLFDSLYMTIISLTTVGYGETHELSQSGKLFTMVLILSGIGNVAIVIRNFSLELISPFFSSTIKEKKMEKKLQAMTDHYIICGLGRIGREVRDNLIKVGKEIVVVDSRPSDAMSFGDIPFVLGDAAQEEILIKAGIKKAKGLVSIVNSDAGNVFITLSARELNPDLFIIARFESESTKRKLKHAGADHTINPYHIGGEKISQIIIKPTISKILDVAYQKGDFQLSIEELDIDEENPLIGTTVRECMIRDQFNVIIIAVEKANGEVITNPGPNYCFRKEDRVVLIANQVEMLALFRHYGKHKE